MQKGNLFSLNTYFNIVGQGLAPAVCGKRLMDCGGHNVAKPLFSLINFPQHLAYVQSPVSLFVCC